MNLNNLYNPNYDLLSTKNKKEILQILGTKYNLNFRYFKEFSAFSKSTFTAVYEAFDKSEFVFVPGEKLRLGLNLKEANLSEILNAQTLKEIARDSFAYDKIYGYSNEKIEAKLAKRLQNKKFLNELNGYIKENLSKEEECLIHPLFAQRYYNETCWKDVPPEILSQNKEWQEIISQAEQEGRSEVAILRSVHFYKDEIWKARLYKQVKFSDLLSELAKNGFDLPSKREWEYLASKGRRSIFAWGNDIDYSMNFRHFALQKQEHPLQKPNFFGLTIADDPYYREIVCDRGKFSYKGGDGGCNVCGGLGVFLGYFPTSPYFKNEDFDKDNFINGNYDFYRKIIRICT